MENVPITQKILKEVKDIPPLPDIVVKVMRITRDPDASADDLTKIIQQDQSLTGNVLRLCNSAHYGLPRVVSSLTQAIMYLGFHTIRSLVLTCSVSHLFSPDKKIYGFDENGLWKHSIATAMTSELICKKVCKDLSDTGFTAGLLLDIGHLILAIKIKDTADSIVDLMQNQDMSDLEAEEATLGVTHTEIGGMLADSWNFPEELVSAIRHHRNPEGAQVKSLLTSICHVADSIALSTGFGVELEQMKYEPQEFALKAVGLSPEKLEELREEAAAAIAEGAEEFLSAGS